VSANAELNRQHAITMVEAALANGVQHAVLSPGARNTPLVLALHDMCEAGRNLTLHSVIDERAAGFYALGLAQRSNSPVLLSCTSGSAGAHYLPAVVEAAEGQVPLVVVTADRPKELQSRGAPQTMAQGDLFRPHARFVFDFGTPSAEQPARWTAGIMAQALAAATGHHPGPVHLNTPFRKPLWSPGPPTTPMDPPILHKVHVGVIHPTPRDIDCLIEDATGKRGVVVCGPDASGRIDPNDANAIADFFGWPILADPVSQLRFGTHGNVVQHQDVLLRSPKFLNQMQPEMVILLGGTPSSGPLQAMLRDTPQMVAIDSSGTWRDPWHSLEWTIASDLHATAETLTARPSVEKPNEWVGDWMHLNQVAAGAIRSTCSDGTWEGSIAHYLAAALPSGSLLRLASSMPIRDVDGFATDGGRDICVSSNRGVNGIDGFIATTLGEARIHKGPVAALSGDLSFLHDMGSLSTVPRPKQPVVITVVDNQGGGIFGFLPMAEHSTGFEPWFVTPHEHNIPKICGGHNVACRSVTSLDEYRSTLTASLTEPGLTVIHVRLDRKSSTAQHHTTWASIQAQVESEL
jgi:2-succinyl-5-enolpyruvyl-6-hydroxy-3-cyclohexene-1-carboxylate synthase